MIETKNYRPWTLKELPFPLALKHKDWEEDHYMIFEVYDYLLMSCASNASGEAVYVLTLEEMLEEWRQRDGSPCGVWINGGGE